MTPTKNILTLQSNKKTVETVLIIYIYIFTELTPAFIAEWTSLCSSTAAAIYFPSSITTSISSTQMINAFRVTFAQPKCVHTHFRSLDFEILNCANDIYIYSLLISALNVTTVLIFLLVATIFINIQHNC